MGAKKFKSALSMFVAFAVSFNSILPATFADKDTIADKRKQVIEIADKILAKDDLATRFRGTTYSNEGNYEKFSETPWYDTWESAQKWKFKAESLSENACDNAISEMMYNDAVYGFPISHVLKKDGFYKGNYKIVKVKSIYGEKHYQEIYKKEKDSLGNDIELKEIKALFDENVRIIKEGNSYDIQMNVKTDKVRELNTAYLNKIATKDVKRQFIKDYKDKEKDGGFILVGIPGELNGENIVVFDMSYVDESGNKKTLPPFGIEIDYASLQRDDKWSDKKSEEELLNKAQRFQMETSAIMESDDAKYVDENKIEDRKEFLKLSYYYSLLQNSNIKNEMYRDYSVNIGKLLEHDKFITENQKYQIKKNWQETRRRALGSMGKEDNIKMLYNLRKNAKYGKINTLREIIGSDVEFFKKIFPVIMTDPNTCSAVFPLQEGIFDLVIFDEASQLKLEEVLPSMMRGKYKIVSGDIHQMPPSNYFGAEMEQKETDNEEIDEESLFLADSESLLDYVNNLNEDVVMSYLDFHYRSKHPKLINFSNAAFYESRLVPMPSKSEYKPIEYYRVNGVYKARKNDDEADRIIEYIFSDKILIDGKLPSVGIVTLNLEQKTNIVNRINSYLRENDSEAVRNRYNELLEKSMFVKNLENVQGDERDVMIFSTTFGKNEDGKFIQNFGPLNNQQKGYKLLNVLITRSKYRFAVFTSIPEENINTWENEITKNGNNGKSVFYAYLAYAQAVSENDTDKENRILDVLAVNKTKYSSIPYEKIQKTDSKIVKIIVKETGLGENEEIVKNYRIGGFILPYAVKDKDADKAKTVIDINDIETFDGKTAYRGLIYRKNMFEGMGYKYKLLNMADYI